MKFDITQANELMRSRRSIFPKDYVQGEKVDDSIVIQMLENANWAPTHKLTEPWRFVVFTGNGLEKLANFQAECYKEVTSKDGTFKEDRYNNLLTKPMQSSHIIAVGMKRDKEKRIKEIEEVGAVFCAIQNMYLTATAYGIGCYLSTGGVTYFEEAKSFFGWEKEDKLIGFLNLGIYRGDKKTGQRKPIEGKVNWVN
ncbi:MAG TPA: nitroreductase [Cytophagales bacterium]|nr:nitroreductase [Cytophagales bacterium]